MTKDEQIKEMESVIRDILNYYNDKDPEVEAWLLVDQEGWRKQLLGTWLDCSIEPDRVHWKCSSCGKETGLPNYDKANYCFNCGAKMLGEDV